MRRQPGRLRSGLLVFLAAVVLADAVAAERCAWTHRNQRDLHLTLAALQDGDIASARRLWSLERQPTLFGLKPLRIAQSRTASGTLEWVLERYPAGQPAAVQLQGVRWVDDAEDTAACPAQRRAALRFERVRVPAASCPDAKATATVLSDLLQADSNRLDERMRGTPPAGPDDLRLVTDGHDYVLRQHRDGDPTERRFGSAATELADAADAVIDAVLSCAEYATADTVTVRL